MPDQMMMMCHHMMMWLHSMGIVPMMPTMPMH